MRHYLCVFVCRLFPPTQQDLVLGVLARFILFFRSLLSMLPAPQAPASSSPKPEPTEVAPGGPCGPANGGAK